MKKALAILMVLALVGAAYAVDVKASLKIDGSAYGTKGMTINDTDTQDDDNLTFAVSGERAGASFRIHAPYAGTSPSLALDEEADLGAKITKGSTAILRKGSIWFKPVDQVKVTLGDTGWALTKEQIDWWRGTDGRVVNGDNWGNNDNPDTATSLLVELTPVEGLNLMAGMDDVMEASSDGKTSGFADITPFGIGGKYSIADVGILGAAYKHVGADVDLIRASFQISAVKDLMAFAKLTLRMDTVGTESQKLNGIGVDLYGAYTKDKFGIKAFVPFAIRKDTDNNSFTMYYDVRAQYAMEGFTPYIRVRDAMKLSGDVDANKGEAKEAINPSIKVAATWNIEVAAFDCGFQYDLPVEDADGVWSLPFAVRVSY